MSSRIIGLIDAGFLAKSTAAALRQPVSTIDIQPDEIISWFYTAARRMGKPFLRAYWYDGLYPEGSQLRNAQRNRVQKLESCSGLQLRLGHMQSVPFEYKALLKKACTDLNIDFGTLMSHFKPETLYRQKGVDTLLVLDLVRFAQQGTCDTIILVGGDRDLAEAVRVTQQLGCTVVLAYPIGAPVAVELRNLADERVSWSHDLLKIFTTATDDRLAALLPESVTTQDEADDNYDAE